MKKRVPQLKTDEQVEAFLAQDLSNLDYSQFKSIQFEFEKKEDQINMRIPKRLLTAVKARAKRAVFLILVSFGKLLSRQSPPQSNNGRATWPLVCASAFRESADLVISSMVIGRSS